MPLHLWRTSEQEADLPREVQDLLAKMRERFPQAAQDLVRRAYVFARDAHEGQARASGEPFVTHTVAVANILAEMRLDPTTIAAALVHDVPEDTPKTLEDVRREFGDEIAALVDGVTKLGKIQLKSREERQAENLRKMFLAMASDIRIVLIKLADRLHNMRTIDYVNADKQKRTARETLEIYAPLTERLGIGRVKRELEDLALKVLEPQAYDEITREQRLADEERQALLAEVVDTLHRELNRAGIKIEKSAITARPKHAYSMWKKMQRPEYQGQGVRRIYDQLGVRVIVNDVKDCYAALGVVHALWRPIPGEFDDYVANPKTSGYQSLHTAVIYRGEPLEIQIRTHEMHFDAEYGIAAHWRYKEGRRDGKASERDRQFGEKLAWMRQLLEWHQEMQDAREFMQSVKLDLFQNEVYVFTPKGDVIDLPAGATPVDFAYRIHTDVGHRTVGAKVNGRLVPLSHRLGSGDIVEIVTSKTAAGPSRDWLGFAVTSNARTKIRQWFKRERREENIQRGRELLERELRRRGAVEEYLKLDRLRTVAAAFALEGEDDLLAAVGNGDLSLLQVVQSLHGEAEAEPAAAVVEAVVPPARGRAVGARVRGVDNVLMHFALCCTPLPGDKVVGYITRGRGVSIHRADCPNLEYLRAHAERFLDVEWESDGHGTFQVDIQVEGNDRVGLLKDILAAVAETHTNVLSVNARVRRDKVAVVDIALDITNVSQLNAVMQRIGKVPEIYTVERVMPSV